MSEELQKLSISIFDNQVGKLWASKGFLSLKPLGSWIDELILRVNFLNNWIINGTPNTFWMSGFFFPQAFVTGSLQNYARKRAIAIDKLSFKFQFLDHINHHSEINVKPEYGCYVYGLFL